MRFSFSPSPTFAATLCLALLTTVFVTKPAQAQVTQVDFTYYITADYTLNTDISNNAMFGGNNVFVGKEYFFSDVPGTITLTVDTGAKITGCTLPYMGLGDGYSGLDVFGHHRASVLEGSISQVNGYNTSIVNISGGTVDIAKNYDNSTVNISGGSVRNAGSEGATINISGGNVASVSNTYGIGGVNISGGSVGSYDGEGLVNISGGSVTSAYIRQGGTMNITGGHIDGVGENNSSIINISGGSVDRAGAVERSTLNISKGNINQVISADSAIVNITGGNITEASNGGSDCTMNISGGNLSNVYSYGYSIGGPLNISRGNISHVYGEYDSLTNISGGTIGEIFANGNSVFNITGGTISASTIYQESDTATINFFGLGIAYTGAMSGTDANTGDTGVFYDVSWTRPDNTILTTRYFDKGGSIANATPQGVTFTLASVVPEAGSLALVLPALGVLGALIVRRRLAI